MYYTLVAFLVEMQLFFAPAIFWSAICGTHAAYLPALKHLWHTAVTSCSQRQYQYWFQITM